MSQCYTVVSNTSRLMIGCEDGTQATGFVTTVGIMELPLVLISSACTDVGVIVSDETIVVGQAFALFVGPISGELLLDSALSAELEARRRIDSSLDDDFNNSFSRSSSL